MGFHAACGVHSVAPYIVDEFVRADDAGDDGAGVDSNAYFEIETGRVGGDLDFFQHTQRQFCHAQRVVR